MLKCISKQFLTCSMWSPLPWILRTGISSLRFCSLNTLLCKTKKTSAVSFYRNNSSSRTGNKLSILWVSANSELTARALYLSTSSFSSRKVHGVPNEKSITTTARFRGVPLPVELISNTLRWYKYIYPNKASVLKFSACFWGIERVLIGYLLRSPTRRFPPAPPTTATLDQLP